jgi:hypothetical protein
VPIHEKISLFRTASRELFNTYFRVRGGEQDGSSSSAALHQGAWEAETDFREVEALLFEKLVAKPSGLTVRYGELQPSIVVKLRSKFCPVMINRGIDSGDWDHPVNEITEHAKLLFISFFDWDALAVRDYLYVRVLVQEWADHADAVGKHALIETQYVSFASIAESPEK